MSPRSEELMDAARRRLQAARDTLGADPGATVSLAYYSMLYAARAALSEQGVCARTHRGTWHEFRRTYVEKGAFDAELASSAQQTQTEREQADYEAWQAPKAEAARVIKLAERFLAAVGVLLGDGPEPD